MRRFALVFLCSSIFVIACEGPPPANTRCNDSRDCAADERCSDGECFIVGAPESDPDVSLERDGGEPEATDGGDLEPDAEPGAEPDAIVDGGDPAVPLDGGFPTDPFAENAFARLSIDGEAVNAGESLRILVEIDDGNRCDLSFQNSNQALSGGSFESVFVPNGDGEVSLACEGATEVLSLTYRVFDLFLRLETSSDENAPDRHVLFWNANHSSSCSARTQDGNALGAGGAEGVVSGNFQSSTVLEVECDGARGIPLRVSFLVEDTALEINASFSVVDERVFLQFSLSAPATCTATTPAGETLLLAADDTHTIDFEPTDEFVGDWVVVCDTGTGAAATTTKNVPQPGGISAFRLLLLANNDLQLEWQGSGSCALDDVEVPNSGRQTLDGGAGLIAYTLRCQSPTGGVVRRQRVFFGDADLDASGNDIDAVVGSATLSANEASVGRLSFVVGSLNVNSSFTSTPPGTISFSALKVVTGDVTVGANARTLTFFDLVRVGGGFRFRNLPDLENLRLFDLETVGGDFVVEQCESLSELRALDLVAVGGHLSVKDLSQASRVDLRNLESIHEVSVRNSPGLTQVRLGNLQTADAVDLANLPLVDDIQLDALRTVTALSLSGVDALEVFEVPELASTASLRVTENASLIEIALPSVTEIGTMEIRFNTSLPNSEALQFTNRAGDFITCPNAQPC